MRPTTLCFPVREDGKILLGRKKRGFGAAKWNGFGGKIEGHETFRQCAVRELWEETGLQANPDDLQLIAFLDFQYVTAPELNHIGYVYFLHTYKGIPHESEEMEPRWFKPEEFPYDQMWKGDRTWLPMILAGRKIEGTVVFAPNQEDVQTLTVTDVKVLQEVELHS